MFSRCGQAGVALSVLITAVTAGLAPSGVAQAARSGASGRAVSSFRRWGRRLLPRTAGACHAPRDHARPCSEGKDDASVTTVETGLDEELMCEVGSC